MIYYYLKAVPTNCIKDSCFRRYDGIEKIFHFLFFRSICTRLDFSPTILLIANLRSVIDLQYLSAWSTTHRSVRLRLKNSVVGFKQFDILLTASVGHFTPIASIDSLKLDMHFCYSISVILSTEHQFYFEMARQWSPAQANAYLLHGNANCT